MIFHTSVIFMNSEKWKCKDGWLKHYGSATVGERGQVVLPAEARKQFGIEPGEKLVVLGSGAGDFEKIVLMRSDAITGLLNHMFDMRKNMEGGTPESIEKMLKKGINQTKKAEKILRKAKGK